MFQLDAESYELKVDQPCIFLRGAHSTECVSGRFCIYLPRPASFKSIRMKLIGLLRVPRDGYLIRDDREHVTFVSDQELGSSRTLSSFQLLAGNYEFPFKIPLTCRMPETVTGPRHMYHSYEVQATIERRFRSNSVVSQPIRIYHLPTLEARYRMISAPTTIEGQTHQNIQYSISIPDSNIPFGSRFPVKCWFAPLSKNMRLCTVRITAVERHSLRVDPTAAESAMYNFLTLTSTRRCTLFTEEHRYSRETLSLDNDTTLGEWSLDLPVSLPNNFESCSQSISTKAIKITHELVVKAEFQDINGLISTDVEENIPFSIYMTPAVIGEDAVLHDQFLQESGEAPPPYYHHNSDTILLEEVVHARQMSMETPQASSGCQNSRQAVGSVPFIGDADAIEPPAYSFHTTM